MKYFKQFIAGTSALVTLPFFYQVATTTVGKNYGYFEYTMVAPFWFGIMNVLSAYIAERYGFTMRQRFLFISLFSVSLIMVFGTIFKVYDFTAQEWFRYYVFILLQYLVVWNIVIYNIEKYMCN